MLSWGSHFLTRNLLLSTFNDSSSHFHRTFCLSRESAPIIARCLSSFMFEGFKLEPSEKRTTPCSADSMNSRMSFGRGFVTFSTWMPPTSIFGVWYASISLHKLITIYMYHPSGVFPPWSTHSIPPTLTMFGRLDCGKLMLKCVLSNIKATEWWRVCSKLGFSALKCSS